MSAAIDQKDFDAHLREHALMSAAHEQEHKQLADIVEQTASRLENVLNITATRLADTVRETAKLHWDNHLLQHQQNERAVDKAQYSMDARLAALDATVDRNKAEGNEWRGTMDDKDKKFATKSDWASNAKDIIELQRWRSASEGKTMGAAPMWALAAAIITAVITAAAAAFFVGH